MNNKHLHISSKAQATPLSWLNLRQVEQNGGQVVEVTIPRLTLRAMELNGHVVIPNSPNGISINNVGKMSIPATEYQFHPIIKPMLVPRFTPSSPCSPQVVPKK
ncbi:hypothetical protein FACS189429_3610 [Bacteroidia bacterium]|nr:hypothetical protein FACS189429_3610 [Bacteroidia bacterium]